MKIIRLTAENYRRLKAVEITPDNTLQVITGRNAQGKTSVLEAIWAAIGGGAASKDTPRPIRDGEPQASVTLDLGDLHVTRTWDAEKGKTELKVTAPDGARYSTPQTLLDGLVGKLSFDPLEFTRLSAKEQRQALLDLLGLDFAAEDRERQRLYDERTETGRAAHAFGDLPTLEKGAPLNEIGTASVVNRLVAAQEQQKRIDQHRTNIRVGLDMVDDLGRQIDQLQQRLAGVRATLAEEQAALEACETPADTDALRAELASVEDHDRQARANQRVREQREQQKALEEKYTALGQQIKAIDDHKAGVLAATEMPVDGLGFTDEGVTYNGVPFQQASSSEQIRVSMAMAMALNPTLRVVRILDGSLLDKESMAAIAAMAKANDYQCWIERVEDDSEAAVLIEDGSVITR